MAKWFLLGCFLAVGCSPIHHIPVQESVQSEQPPFQARSHYIRGQVLAAQGNFEGAQTAFAQARIFDPDEPRILMAMGHSSMNAGDVDTARGYMKNAALLADEDPDPWLVHGRLEMAFGDKELGRKALQQAVLLGDSWVARATLIDDSLGEQGASADLALLAQWTETTTNDPVELRRRGSLRTRAGDSSGGVDDYLEAMRLAQRDLSIVGPFLQAAIQGRREAYGLIKIERWLAEDPTATAGWLTYGLLSETVGDHQETVRALEKVETFGVGLGEGSARALNDARKRIEHPPRTPASRPPPLGDPISRSLTLMEEERWHDAERVVNKQLEQHPKDARMLYISAQIVLERDGPIAAQPMIEKVLAVQPGYAPALNLWAWVHCDQGVFLEDAEQKVQQALSLQPRVGGYWDTLGWIFYRQGRHVESQLILERAVRLSPHDVGIQEHLSQVSRVLRGGTP
jgi:tetratricopeptide (TPR) repeat protein